MLKKIIADPWRGLDFYSPAKDKYSHAVIVGCGAIGSYVAFGLARMGVKKLTLIDHDIVEAHNIPNQFFAEGNTGLTEGILKTVLLENTIKYMVRGVEIVTFPMKWEEIHPSDKDRMGYASAIVTAVDDMGVRREIFDDEYPRKYCKLLLDSRTGGMYANVLAIRMSDREECAYYSSSLHPNSEAAPLPCSGQAVVDTSMGVSAELIGRYRALLMGDYHPALHSFHDYSTGCSYILQERKKNYAELTANEILTDEFAHSVGNTNIGGENASGNTDNQ